MYLRDNDKNINPLSANPTQWSNTLKQFVGNLPTNCLSVFDHFVKLALKGLILKNQFAQGSCRCWYNISLDENINACINDLCNLENGYNSGIPGNNSI